MSGVTDYPFRNLIASLGGVPLVVSEMIASEAMIRETRQSLAKVVGVRHEGVTSVVQLAGVKPDVMADAAKIAVDLGADVVDINMGCPAKKVVGCFSGSALMRDLAQAKSIVRAVVRAVSVPVTLKMRKGWDDSSQNAPELAAIAEAEGVKMLTVHGRTRCQFYRGSSDWDFFKEVKATTRLPVIGNGDIKTPEDARKVMESTGVDGVMIGRGCYGRPWLFRQVHSFLKGGDGCLEPTKDEKKAIIQKHLDAMLSFYGTERGGRIARKHLAWYSREYKNGSSFRQSINQSDDFRNYPQMVQAFFRSEGVCA